MRFRPAIFRPRHVLAATTLLVHFGGVFPPAAEAAAGAKKDLRDARTAVQAGRLADGLEAYERILESTATEKQRFESLYNTVLIPLALGTDDAAAEVVRERLDALETLVESGKYSHKLEVQTLAVLVAAQDGLEAAVDELEQRLVSEAAAAQLASEEQRRDAAEALAAQKELVGAERQQKLLLELRLESLAGHLATREEQLEASFEELGQCNEEMRLVLDQLQGTQGSEVQMLQAVVRKNEELAKAQLALQRQERVLADQAKQLELKEEEIRKREEAIREVTERVLGKDPPDS